MAVKDRDRFSTATRIRIIGEQTAARVYRSQTKRQARRSRLTGRAALLAMVFCSLVVALAYPIRQYVAQRAEIADLREEQRQTRQRVEDLRDLKARWQDVMPGESGFVVIDPDAAEQTRTGLGAADRPWYRNVWDGVDKADAVAHRQ
jgi:cell division protein FtsB